MAATKSRSWILALVVPFVLAGTCWQKADDPAQPVWTADADGCPDTCRRAGDCRLEPFDGEGCVASCESGVEIYKCIKKARSCSDMESCK